MHAMEKSENFKYQAWINHGLELLERPPQAPDHLHCGTLFLSMSICFLIGE